MDAKTQVPRAKTPRATTPKLPKGSSSPQWALVATKTSSKSDHASQVGDASKSSTDDHSSQVADASSTDHASQAADAIQTSTDDASQVGDLGSKSSTDHDSHLVVDTSNSADSQAVDREKIHQNKIKMDQLVGATVQQDQSCTMVPEGNPGNWRRPLSLAAGARAHSESAGSVSSHQRNKTYSLRIRL